MSVTETPAGILTFLIADVRGYTAYTQAHGDEGAARLADKFAEIAREGVEAHGGEVTELRGDEALAVFSSPRSAVRAAVALQTVFADETVLDPSMPLTVGIGIDAGEAVPVQGGYRGGALNLAARLCSKAVAGEVLVSQGVAHLTRAVDGIDLVEAGVAEVKGLSAPVQVFRALTERAPIAAPPGRGELPSALDAVTPIVGRETESRQLRWLWRNARRGAATVCVVQGAPGIGKTRLAAEVAATAAAGGGVTRYLSLAVDAADVTTTFAVPSQQPELIVVDDVETADPDQLVALEAVVSSHQVGARMVVLVVEDESASTQVLTVTHRLAGSDDRVIRPRPLTVEEMLRVAGFYVGPAVDVLPRDLLTATGGNPRLVHERVSEWAQGYAARRLGDLATAAAAGRSDLRSVESDLAGTVIDLQLVREQATLFGLGPGRRAPEPTESPYRGLASFDVTDADVFFGRERLVAELVSRLAGANLLGVVGASGSGKSSAVRAGLLPALASGVLPGSERWTVAVLRPGEHPVRALDRALWTALPASVTAALDDSEPDLEAVRTRLADGERLLIVVDQFEEVFTLCRDDNERARFLAGIAHAASHPDARIGVVVAVRADYYGRCAADAQLAELLANNHLLVGAMSAEEYRRAIVQPALRVGAAIEPELVDDLVAEVLGEPGALPLLSTALLELWDHRDGRTLRRASYLETGGVHGAVARLADEVYDGFDDEQRRVARGVLLRLAGPGLGDAVVRRRVPLSEFDVERDETVREVVEVLAARRLITVSDGSAEVAHEALLREWPRLQTWLEEDREGRRLRAHLAVAAQEWATRHQDEGELYRGARLSAALDWTTHHSLELNEVEREFITASRTASQAELIRQQRQNRRLRGLLVGVIGVMLLALVAGSVALVQRHSAQRAAREALARQLGAEAVSTPRIDEAMLLARQAVLFDRSDATEGTLLATLLRSPAVRQTFTMPIQFRPLAIALSPDGHTLAVGDNSGSVRFFDTRTRRLLPTVVPTSGGLVTLFAGGHFFADSFPSGSDPVINVFDANTLRKQQSLTFSKEFLTQPTGQNNPIVASADGQRLFFPWTLVVPGKHQDGKAYVESWDLQSKTHQLRPLPGTGMVAARVLADGNLMVVTDDAVITVDGATLRVLHRTPLALGSGAGDVSPDGRTVAFLPNDATLDRGGNSFVLYDVRSGARTPAGGAHSAAVQKIGFDPTGRYLLTTSDDHQVDVWDGRSGALVETLSGHGGRVLGLAFSADGQTAYTASLDGAIFAWDLGSAARFGRPFRVSAAGQEMPSRKPALAVAPDSRSFAARTGVGTIGLFALHTLRPDRTVTLPAGEDVEALDWSRGGVLAVARASTGAELWTTAGTPRLLRTLTGVKGTLRSVSFSPDGRTVAGATDLEPPPGSNASPQGWFGVWDVATGRLINSSKLKAPGWPTAWSPDGSRVVTGDDGGQIYVADARGRVEHTFHDTYADNVVSLAFLSNHVLVSGGWDGIVQHWDVATGKQLGQPVLTESSPVGGLAIAPGGSRFAVGAGASGGLKIWDDATRQQFGAAFPGANGTWQSLAYTPDGANIITVYDDGSASVWPVTVSAWMNQACAVAGRNFTHEEWNRFVPGHSYARTCPGTTSA